MRIPRNPADVAILTALIFPFLATGNNFDCSRIVVGDVPFNLKQLGGPRSVMHSDDHGTGLINTTYTIDICAPLRPKKGEDHPKERCPTGTQLCAIERVLSGDTDTLLAAYPIAGDLQLAHGKAMDAKWTLLRKSSSNEDSAKEGLSVEMHGGFRKVDGREKAQKAVVEFLCDRTRDGTENLIDPEDKYMRPEDKEKEKEKRDEDKKKDSDSDDDSKTSSLEFVRYDTSSDVDVLRLKWRTKFACEDSKSEQDAEKKGGWGLFTWFILIAFLSTATYLIFGSWLNYNRHGARGWDLLPHGDTIRDVPYLLKDWSRRVVNSVQGGGSRGGYAAV